MLKSIQLKLSKIKYGGDSIGRDIRVEIEVLGKFLRVDKRIKAGTTAKINREIGRFETDRGLFQAGVFITVIEKDLLFNDVGKASGSVKINTTLAKPQQFVFEVQVREARSILGKFWGKKIANFEIILEAIVGDIERYIPDIEDGWLRAWDAKYNEIAFPAYVKVKSEYIKNKREYFTPLEGVYRHQLVSTKLQNDGFSYLISGIKHEPMARASYSISTKLFILNGKKYKTVDYPAAPWEKGLYDIEIPDYPHGRNDQYTEAKRQKVWFKIGHSGKRYLHVGSRSIGCMTIIEITRWMEIYNAVIKARKGDLMSVGVVEIID
ncbi:MAG: hypothetical protein CEN91_399 [Candidatus Berkelbacteria bacterium Licking1014_85]|uniref:Uncharacterized protein n=1 Tax=Candidatus Berkelbacteria bacterium Licking1014_85 TaxID=2017148 RepID=A0A554LIA4_9BACT|nr:MAG: hypothetical protein CEN91_399 [Candidatus Berkelbacteria bacterium Licking1014_85]